MYSVHTYRAFRKSGAMGLFFAAFLAAGALAACANEKERLVETKAGALKVETVTDGLQNPWGLAFLPDGRMLVTERAGHLRIVGNDGAKSEALKGVPDVVAEGQGGLLDVALDPKFEDNRLVYLSYAERGDGGVGTAVARGKLGDDSLTEVKVIWRQQPKIQGRSLHFGSRLVFAPDGTLFITTGDRFEFAPAQDLSTSLGKVLRINPDGSVPEDNPFVTQEGALPEIYSYGHRHAQGAAINPETGALWETEFGPLGGDELNIIVPGKDYGWPAVSWGKHYNGTEIPDPPTQPEFTDAIKQWTPVISPSGIAFYTADAIPGWKGDLLIAGLSSQGIVRVTVQGDKVTGEERIPLGARIRNVVQGPDGAVYALTDAGNGEILRIALASPRS